MYSVVCMSRCLLLFLFVFLSKNNCLLLSYRPRQHNRMAEYTDPVVLCQTSKHPFVVMCFHYLLSYRTILFNAHLLYPIAPVCMVWKNTLHLINYA